jgi:hypothetical protein
MRLQSSDTVLFTFLAKVQRIYSTPSDKRKRGDDYCRLSNKEIVITAVKVVITAHP